HTRFSRDWSSDVCSSDLRFSSTLLSTSHSAVHSTSLSFSIACRLDHPIPFTPISPTLIFLSLNIEAFKFEYKVVEASKAPAFKKDRKSVVQVYSSNLKKLMHKSQ